MPAARNGMWSAIKPKARNGPVAWIPSAFAALRNISESPSLQFPPLIQTLFPAPVPSRFITITFLCCVVSSSKCRLQNAVEPSRPSSSAPGATRLTSVHGHGFELIDLPSSRSTPTPAALSNAPEDELVALANSSTRLLANATIAARGTRKWLAS